MSELQPNPDAKPDDRWTSDSDARLAARLKQLLEMPGISDKDRKLVERNLSRLIEAQTTRSEP